MDPYQVARDNHVIVVLEPLAHVNGYYCNIDGLRLIHVNDQLPSYYARYVTAHMLYGALHRRNEMLVLKEKQGTLFTDAEREANAYAMRLLMSGEEAKTVEDLIEKYIPTEEDRADLIQRLTRIWGDRFGSDLPCMLRQIIRLYKEETRMSYAIYLRKSRKDMDLEALGQGETLARHREALLELAAKRDLTIGRIYEEIVSGESIADRPVMQELLDDVVAGTWEGVLVMEVERLARGNTKDQGEVAEAFSLSNTLIVTPAKTYDPNDEFDEEYFEFGLFMSRREYKTIRRRMQRGTIASVKEGNFLGNNPPFGYDIIHPNKKERTLTPNDRAQYVQLIFDWYVNKGMSTGEIARTLNNMGVKTPQGAKEWGRNQIAVILKNDAYRGKIRWGKKPVTKEKVDGQIKKVRRTAPVSECLIVDGKHPAIISDELFFKAQELLKVANPVNFEKEFVNPFAGILRCKDCGRVLLVAHRKTPTGKVYRISHPDSQLCHKKSLLLDAVMYAVVGALRAHVRDFEIKADNTHLQEERRQADALRAQTEKEIAALERKRASLFDYLEDGTYSRAEFTERRAVLSDRIEALQRVLEELAAVPEVDYQEKIVKFSEVLDSLADPKASAKDKNKLLKEIIDHIDYDVEDFGHSHGGAPILDIYFR